MERKGEDVTRYRPKEGYVQLWRRIRDHRFWPTYKNRAFTELEAWFDLLFDAAFAPHRRTFKGKTFDLKTGELVCSQNELAKRWRWKRSSVRSFLESLYLNGEAVHEESQNITKISICKLTGCVGYTPTSHPEATSRPHKKGYKKVLEESTTLSPNKGDVLTGGILTAWRNRKKKGSK